MLVVVLTVLVAVFGRLEIRPRRPMAPRWMSRQDPGSSLAALLTVGAYGCVVAGLLANNLAPNSGDYPLGMPAAGLVAYLVGAGVLRLLRGLPATARAPVSARAQPPRRRARDP
jgi:hypothetical protein